MTLVQYVFSKDSCYAPTSPVRHSHPLLRLQFTLFDLKEQHLKIPLVFVRLFYHPCRWAYPVVKETQLCCFRASHEKHIFHQVQPWGLLQAVLSRGSDHLNWLLFMQRSSCFTLIPQEHQSFSTPTHEPRPPAEGQPVNLSESQVQLFGNSVNTKFLMTMPRQLASVYKASVLASCVQIGYRGSLVVSLHQIFKLFLEFNLWRDEFNFFWSTYNNLLKDPKENFINFLNLHIKKTSFSSFTWI